MINFKKKIMLAPEIIEYAKFSREKEKKELEKRFSDFKNKLNKVLTRQERDIVDKFGKFSTPNSGDFTGEGPKCQISVKNYIINITFKNWFYDSLQFELWLQGIYGGDSCLIKKCDSMSEVFAELKI